MGRYVRCENLNRKSVTTHTLKDTDQKLVQQHMQLLSKGSKENQQQPKRHHYTNSPTTLTMRDHVQTTTNTFDKASPGRSLTRLA